MKSATMTNNDSLQLTAEHLYSGRYVVRPIGGLGAVGWYPKPWTAYFTNARSPQHAIRKAIGKVFIAKPGGED